MDCAFPGPQFQTCFTKTSGDTFLLGSGLPPKGFLGRVLNTLLGRGPVMLLLTRRTKPQLVFVAKAAHAACEVLLPPIIFEAGLQGP